ncbi:MAG: hypothetical protein KF778_14670 [Rhodocyclaceae bacterium]|nr:hypothetical protein [Rhodocyclaceae bacterium]MBX3669641.1 hypothetical protein [Rhodocyclaceae bacterium]
MPSGKKFDFSNSQACLRVLERMQVQATAHARDSMAQLLRGMQHTPPPPLEYLAVLERMRVPLAIVLREMAEPLTRQPIPPGQPGDETLRFCVTLWLTMAKAYARVAELGSNLPAVQRELPLICQRCVHYAGRAITTYYGVHREVPRGLWLELHGYYATAEEWQLARVPVHEPLCAGTATQSSEEAYIAILLVELANPYSRNLRELDLTLRWAQRFAPYADLQAPDSAPDLRSYAVDLVRDSGPLPLQAIAAGSQVRCLLSGRLAAEIEHCVAKLRGGTAPSALGLGENCAARPAARLLVQLYRPWCQAATPRRFPRHKGQGEITLFRGFEIIHDMVSGKKFRQPELIHLFYRPEFEAIVTFGERVESNLVWKAREADMPASGEPWHVADQSATGFRVARPAIQDCLACGELVGCIVPDSPYCLLARVTWSKYESSGRFSAGLEVFAGAPKAVALRAYGPDVPQTEAFERAFLLPALPALKIEARLVLPRGWFESGRMVQIYDDKLMVLRLHHADQQGVNYDRVGFHRVD